MTNHFEPISFSLWRTDKGRFATELGSAFGETGFAVITEHGLDPSIIAAALAKTKAFFALPEVEKRSYHNPNIGGQRGFTPFKTENAKGHQMADLKEFWHTGRDVPLSSPLAETMPPTPRVTQIAGFDQATRALYNALDRLGREILKGVALYLGLEEAWFEPRVSAGNSILRLLHYPAQSVAPPPGSVRAAAHEDINVITLLLGAQEAGLEVLHRSGRWLAVNPPAGALVVNVGDMLQRLTNGVLLSTTHRVVNPQAQRAAFARYSTPFFLHFEPDVLIEPLASCRSHKPPEPPITAQAYLLERLREIGLMRDA